MVRYLEQVPSGRLAKNRRNHISDDWEKAYSVEETIPQPENNHAVGTNPSTWDRQAERTNTILADNLQQILLSSGMA
jgi:hypothetical protein